MELLLVLGAVAVVILLAVGGYLFLQQRRAGTIRAVSRPRRQAVDPNEPSDKAPGRDK